LSVNCFIPGVGGGVQAVEASIELGTTKMHPGVSRFI